MWILQPTDIWLALGGGTVLAVIIIIIKSR